VFESERFYREAWPTISQAVSPSDAARDVTLIATISGVPWLARAGDPDRREHIRLYSAHELASSLDAGRLVIVARK